MTRTYGRTSWMAGAPAALLIAGLALAGIAALAASGSARAEVPILPVDQIRPGMTGIGRTVFSGDSISTFEVEILDVIRNARPAGNLVLFRGRGEVLEHAGIIAGMSGSPVYVEGRLVGAVAFAYPMVKDPIGAITPIEEMLEVGRQQSAPAAEVDGMEAGPLGPEAALPAEPARPGAAGSAALEAFGAESDPIGASEQFSRAWRRFLRADPAEGVPFFPAAAAEASGLAVADEAPLGPRRTGAGLRPMSIPVTLQGWMPAAADELSASLAQLGFLPVTGTASGSAAAGASSGAANSAAGTGRLEPGSAVAVSLISGDVNLSAVGTVTWVDGDQVLAFGHPLFQGGVVSLPMHAARIHSVMPSRDVSFKMGSAGSAIGGIRQDRRAAIYGLLGPVPETLPVRVSLRLPGAEPTVYRYRVVRDRVLTPFLLPWTVTNSWLHGGWVQGDAVARCDVAVGYNHGSVLRRTERIKADAPPLQFAGAATLPAGLLLVNPFERATLDSVSIELTVERRNAQAFVTSVRADRPRLRAGEELRVTVTLEPWRAAREEREFVLRARPEWAGQRLQIVAGSAGDFMDWDRDRAAGKYSPRNLRQLVELVETVPDDGSLIVRVLSNEPGNLVDGREVASLPPSLAAPGTASGGRAIIRRTAGQLLLERTERTPWVLSGRETVEVEVMP